LNAKYVAVRSSATAEDSLFDAWAGQFDSFLNVTSDELLTRVRQCWASLYNSRALSYRLDRGYSGRAISVPVIVQKMIQGRVAGTAFSVHPVTQQSHQLIVEAGYGLGEAVVSGVITPDSYIVDKGTQRII